MLKQFIHTMTTIDWNAFHFLRPKALWLFIPLLLIILLLLVGNREQKKWKRIIAPALRPYMFTKGNPAAIIFPLLLLVFGLSCMILSLAGPTWDKREIPGEKIPSVVLISLDLSKSMLATDIQPSRLERAKMKITDLLNANPRARAGLIAYAGTPHTVLPFTSDYNLIKHHAVSLYNWEMPVQGTNMVLNIGLIDTMMKRVEAPSTVLLMTDNIDDNEAVLLNDYVNNSIHHLEILLFSTPDGAPVPGAPDVISKQSSTTLDNLRQNNKINITPITLDKSDVETIAKRVRDNLIFEKKGEKDEKDWDDMGWLLLIPALIIALFWFRKGWAVQWSWALLFMLSFSSCGIDSKHPGWWYTENYQGELWYEKGDYQKAAEHFSDIPHKAAAYFKAGDYQSAAELLVDDTTAIGRYNYGLSLAKMGMYDDAVTAFQQAASEEPSLQSKANRNIDAVRLMKDQAGSAMRFKAEESMVDKALKAMEKEKLKERRPTSEDEQLSSDTEVKKLPTHGDRLSDEVESDVHRAKEQKFPPKDFKMDPQMPVETKVLMQKTNADPGEFLHRRFEIQKQKYYPEVTQEKKDW
ncbi:MAG: VWA domain-containing protein [Tannerella sp.]|nr:VWA domain-containing protein [Tannerella sp.]